MRVSECVTGDGARVREVGRESGKKNASIEVLTGI